MFRSLIFGLILQNKSGFLLRKNGAFFHRFEDIFVNRTCFLAVQTPYQTVMPRWRYPWGEFSLAFVVKGQASCPIEQKAIRGYGPGGTGLHTGFAIFTAFKHLWLMPMVFNLGKVGNKRHQPMITSHAGNIGDVVFAVLHQTAVRRQEFPGQFCFFYLESRRM